MRNGRNTRSTQRSKPPDTLSCTARQRREASPRGGASTGPPLARCAGRINSDSISEKSRLTITMIGRPRTSFPIEPGTASIGRNAATVVSTPKITGVARPCAPRIAPSSLLALRFCSTCVFSPTTIASSTRMPSTSTRPIREIQLIETPRNGSTAKVPSSAVGTPHATHAASRRRRNSASTTSTMIAPCQALLFIEPSRSARMLDMSCQTTISTPAGSVARVRST